MTSNKYFPKITNLIQNTLLTYLREKRSNVRKIDKLLASDVLNLEKYIKGGKFLRGYLTFLGFRLAGGNIKNNDIVKVASGVELLHNFLLIHDDIVDNDKLRRGKPTIHEVYSQKRGRKYGISKGIIVGDMASFLGYELIINSNFPKNALNEALSCLNKLLLTTCYGEIMDIDFDFKKDLLWKDIEKVRIHKTAYYTIVMPLTIGAILGGADKSMLGNIEKFGIPLGICFQLTDDILGVFGDVGKTGKSNQSDIIKGKKTFIYAEALERANKADKKFLLEKYGNKSLSGEDIDVIRRIFEKTGSVTYSKKLATSLANKSKKYVNEITQDYNLQSLLLDFVDFLLTREK